MSEWCTPENMNQACEHGHQRRKCPYCESIWQDKLIASLEQQVYAEDGEAYNVKWAMEVAKVVSLTKERDRYKDTLGKLANFAVYAPINKSHMLWAEGIAKKALEDSQ